MDEKEAKKILRKRAKEAYKAQLEAERKLAHQIKLNKDLLLFNKKLHELIDFKETEARLQDNAIDRDTTIIHYLESKICSMISDYNKN